MKLEKLQKLQCIITIISTILIIIFNIRDNKRKDEEHKARMNEFYKYDKIQDDRMEWYEKKKEEEQEESLTGRFKWRCIKCKYSGVLMSKEPCLSCVTGHVDNFEAEG